MEFQNYGDVNFYDYGGIMIAPDNYENTFRVILLVPNPDKEEEVFAGYTSFDISDYKDDQQVVSETIASFGKDYTDEQFAVSIIENMGISAFIEMGMSAFNENGYWAGYGDINAFAISKEKAKEEIETFMETQEQEIEM